MRPISGTVFRLTAGRRDFQGHHEVVMQARRLDHDNTEILVTRAELDVLRQCLNEVRNGIAIPEFETRIGAGIDEVRAMLRILREAAIT